MTSLNDPSVGSSSRAGRFIQLALLRDASTSFVGCEPRLKTWKLEVARNPERSSNRVNVVCLLPFWIDPCSMLCGDLHIAHRILKRCGKDLLLLTAAIAVTMRH